MMLKKIEITHKAKVYVNVYGITPFNKYLNCCGMGGYHTGLEIKYIFKNNLSLVTCSFASVSLMKVRPCQELS